MFHIRPEDRGGMASLVTLLLLTDVAKGAYVDALPGWMGELNYVGLRTKANGKPTLHQQGNEAINFDPTRIIRLSWNPRAFIYKGFLSEEECDHLINVAKDKLEKSMVADNESGKSVLSTIRTSSGMFIEKGKDSIISSIEEKIATWTFLPKENGEAIQVLRYQNGEKYEPHYDFFRDKYNQAFGGHRVATVLMYLTNVKMGGETLFPNVMDSEVKDETWSECGKRGLAVKPERGDALLFFSLHPDATPDVISLHGSCPVIEGEKWSATKWIHVDSFDRPSSKFGACEDENEQCAKWAATGECMENPAYMVGSSEDPGSCRKSCKAC